MSRTLKRVPLDFAWPLKKVWHGYLNPYSGFQIECVSCKSSGYSSQAKLFSDQWYGDAPFDPVSYDAIPLQRNHPRIRENALRNVARDPGYFGVGERAIQSEISRLYDHYRAQWSRQLIQADVDALIKAGRLHDFTRVPHTEAQRELVKQNGRLSESNGYTPTAAEVNDWSLARLGHDSINRGVCIEARCDREGVPYVCTACEGNGHSWPSPELEKLYEEWEHIEPPVGPGYQLWETTGEGSPITPVFFTLEDLCSFAADNSNTFADFKATAAEWKKMLEKDFVIHAEGDRIFL
jgi:hypothetical protein